MKEINIDHLSQLKGEQLSSVIFVQDYLQLDFDGLRLTCYKWPKVIIDKVSYSFGESEYRNAICRIIASEVEDINTTSIDVSIKFKSGVILFPIVDDEEVIYFVDRENGWSYYPSIDKLES